MENSIITPHLTSPARGEGLKRWEDVGNKARSLNKGISRVSTERDGDDVGNKR